MRIFLWQLSLGIMFTLCACSDKSSVPVQPVTSTVKEVPRNRGRMLLEPVESSKFSQGSDNRDTAKGNK